MLRLRTLALCMFFTAFLFGQETTFTAKKVELQKGSKVLEKEFRNYDLYRFDYQNLDRQVKEDGEDINFNLKLGDKYDWDLYLYPKDIRSSSYNVYAQTENGIEIQPRRPNMTYRGHLKGADGGKAGFTINDHHFAGTVKDGDVLYFVEPLHYMLKSAPKDILIVYAMSDVIPNDDLTCGADEVLENQLHNGHDHEEERPDDGGARDGLCLEIELAIASDFAMYQDYNQSVAQVEDHNITVMNNVGTNWDDEFNDEMVFVIVTQFVSTCNTCDPWTASTDAVTLLESFRSWGNNGGFAESFDLGQLWTDRNINGGTVGIAYVGAVCTQSRYHVVQDFTTSQQRLRVMTAHEIGHNFNALHDGDNDPFIMRPSVNTSTTWSTASQNRINSRITLRFNQGCFSQCPDVGEPVAEFAANQTSGCVPLQVNFTDLSSNSPTLQLVMKLVQLILIF